MRAFKIKYPLQELVEHYPDPKLLLRVAREGGEEAQGVIARLWLSEGIPSVFLTCPAVYDAMRYWLGKRLEVHPKEIGLVGSAHLGKSLKPCKIGTPFIPNESDLDLFIVSENLFERLKIDFFAWSCDFKMEKLSHHTDGNLGSTGKISIKKFQRILNEDSLTHTRFLPGLSIQQCGRSNSLWNA